MEKQKVLLKLQNLCSKKECCSSDIYKKALADLEGDKTAAQEVLDSLVEDKFVDDLRYCSAYAREKSQLTGWGPIKISYQLMAKGMSKSLIKQALEEIDSDKAEQRLDKVLEAKYRTVKGEPDEKFRLIKFALTRGYEYDDVSRAVNALLEREKLKAELEEESSENES